MRWNGTKVFYFTKETDTSTLESQKNSLFEAALAMAEGMEAQNGKVVTVEIDPYLKKFCDPFFNKYNKNAKRDAIDMRIGCAIEVMKDLAKTGETFDLVFVDANKSE